MKTAKEIMQSAAALGACAKSGGVSDWKSLVWLFFTPQGREFCQEHNFPSLPQPVRELFFAFLLLCHSEQREESVGTK